MEFFGKDGWKKCFKPEPLRTRDRLPMFTIDAKANIYLFVEAEEGSRGVGNYFVYKCGIKDRSMYCEKISQLDHLVSQYPKFLPDGDMVFDNDRERCISRFSPWWERPRCIIKGARLIGVSGDGRWLVYERNKVKRLRTGEFSHEEYDLYRMGLCGE